jgi:hypothetical protein
MWWHRQLAEGEKIMEAVLVNYNPPESSFRIKDLMVGELLCQAGVVTDAQLMHFANLARASKASIGSALVFSRLLTSSELFVARRLVNRRQEGQADCPPQFD